MRLFNGFFHKYELKNKAAIKPKVCQVFSSLSLNDVGIYLRNGSVSSDIGVVTLHSSKRTHRVSYINEVYFDSYGCGPSYRLSKYKIKPNGHCLFSENNLQGLTIKQD